MLSNKIWSKQVLVRYRNNKLNIQKNYKKWLCSTNFFNLLSLSILKWSVLLFVKTLLLLVLSTSPVDKCAKLSPTKTDSFILFSKLDVLTSSTASDILFSLTSGFKQRDLYFTSELWRHFWSVIVSLLYST